MGKLALLFPGQGAQYVGMGQDLYDKFEISKHIFNTASECLGYDMAELCFNGPEEQLQKTEVTQPATLTVGIAIWKVLEQNGLKPLAIAGLSLGEYSALVAAEVLTFSEAVSLVQKRGRFMQEAVPQGIGTMAAIIGLTDEQILSVCSQASAVGIVEPANYNCPGQIVIGGEVKAVEKACQIANELGARKAVPLAVSAPFHTSMLRPTAVKLSNELSSISFCDALIPVVSSVTGNYLKAVADVPQLLADQVCSPVLWETTMRCLLNDGFDSFIEVGPGKTLKGFMRRIDRSVTVESVNDHQELMQVIEKLEA